MFLVIFLINLPRTLNTTQNTLAFIDDIAIPNVFKTIENRSQKMYVSIFSNDSRYDEVVTIPTDNYNGITFASAMQTQVNSLATLMQNITSHFKMMFNVSYDFTQNS